MRESTDIAVVDASWIAAFLLPDEDSERVTLFFQQLKTADILLAAPSLLEYEVANILRTVTMQKRITQKTAHSLMHHFQNLSIQYYHLDPRDVLTGALNYAVSAYDASYLSLAIQLQAPLYTLDSELYRNYQAFAGTRSR